MDPEENQLFCINLYPVVAINSLYTGITLIGTLENSIDPDEKQHS